MFTIEQQNEAGETYKTTRDALDEAQQYARQWINFWKSTVIYITGCPKLVMFEATQFNIIVEKSLDCNKF